MIAAARLSCINVHAAVNVNVFQHLKKDPVVNLHTPLHPLASVSKLLHQPNHLSRPNMLDPHFTAATNAFRFRLPNSTSGLG